MKRRIVYLLLILLTIAIYLARVPLETFIALPVSRAQGMTPAPTASRIISETPQQSTPTPTREATATAAPAPTRGPATTPTPLLPEPRIFIASERTNTIQVWQGEPPRFLTAIPVGYFPHNISVSNDARWVATANRWSNDVSIIDPLTLTETARLRVGNSPHDLAWAPDDKRLYITQEKDFFISVIDTTLWKTTDLIRLDSPQHDLAISPDGGEIWATTIQYRGLLIIDRLTRKVIDQLKYFPHGSHDITFRPDVNEVWVTSSGFIRSDADIDPYVVIFDRTTHKLKASQPLGHYPFHSVKLFRDALFLPRNANTLWYSDRGLGGVIQVSVPERRVLTEIKTGAAPFHLSFGPNGLLYVANHDDATFSVIDPLKPQLLHTIRVAPDPHGIVVLAATP